MVHRLAPLAAIALLGGCADVCQNTAISSSASPDGHRQAVVFLRDCGATTDFSTQVSILRDSGSTTGGGNLFVADGGSASAEPTAHGGPWVEVIWQGPRHLLVRYDSLAEVYKQRDQVAGVEVTYEPVQR